MTEPMPPDPSNSPPEEWTGEVADDQADLNRLLTLTAGELATGADLDRAEGIS